MSVIYLASPYTHEDRAVEIKRFEQVCKVAGRLMIDGNTVFCPIAMGHPIQEHSDPSLPRVLDWWMEHDFALLEKCDILAVLMLTGWKESPGVAAEMDFAGEWSTPIIMLNPNAYL